MESRPILLAFNRGLVSPYALARVDLKRMALSAQTQTNWLPRVLGAMSLRNGTRLVRPTRNDLYAVHIPFVFSISDTATLEFTDGTMRVDVGGEILTYPAVSTTVPAFPVAATHPVTITNATPAVFTYTGSDDYAELDPITLSTTGALPDGLVAGTRYLIRNLNATAKTFNVSLETSSALIATTSAASQPANRGCPTRWVAATCSSWAMRAT